MSDDNTYSYWETGHPPTEATVSTFDQIASALKQYESIEYDQLTVKHWQTDTEFDAVDFMEHTGLTNEYDDDEEEDRSGHYRLWEQGYRSQYTLYSSFDELLNDLKAMATPEADDENKIYRGRFVVQKWDTKETFDAVDFLAAQGVTVPEDYDPPSTVYRLYHNKQEPYSYMPFDDLGELVDEYYGQGIDIGIRRKQNVLNKATGEITDVVDILATVDFTTISLPRYEVWQTKYDGQREVPMEIETDTVDSLFAELVDLERAQEGGTIEPGVMSIFDYSTGKESDLAAFLKKNRKLIKAARDSKPT